MRPLLLPALLAACASPPGADALLPGEATAAPMVLEVPRLYPGEVADIVVTGVVPGGEVRLLSSEGGPAGAHVIRGIVVNLAPPVRALSSARFADASGTARFSIPVPGSVAWGEEIALQAVARPSTAGGSPSRSNVALGIVNTPPSTALRQPFASAVPTVRDPIVAVPTSVVDADRDPVELVYQWFVDGAPVPADRGGLDAVLPAGVAARGDAVAFLVTPRDAGASGGMLPSPTITVRNALPAAPVLGEITPLPAGDDDDLRCIVASQEPDPDGDAISYRVEWLRFRPADPLDPGGGSGVSTIVQVVAGVPAVTGPAWTLPADVTEPGDRVQCLVTPFDSSAGPTTVSNVAIVEDLQGPSAPRLDALPAYQADATVHLTGACTHDPVPCVLVGHRCDGPGGAVVSGSDDACDGERFEVVVGLPVAGAWSCHAWCEDGLGQGSYASESRTTEVCGTSEAAETLGDGPGDALDLAVDLGVLADVDGARLTVDGNVLGPGGEGDDRVDWYRLHAEDVDEGTADTFAFRAIVTGDGYDVLVLRDHGTFPLVEPDPSYPGADAFAWTPADDGPRCTTMRPDRDACLDLGADFFVRVARPSGEGCGGYTLTLSNGL